MACKIQIFNPVTNRNKTFKDEEALKKYINIHVDAFNGYYNIKENTEPEEFDYKDELPYTEAEDQTTNKPELQLYNGKQYTQEELEEVKKNEEIIKNSKPTKDYNLNQDKEVYSIFKNPSKVEDLIPEQLLKNTLKLNPTLLFQFNEDKDSHYSPSTNTVNISLHQIYNFANENNLTYETALNYFLEHELAHSTTAFAASLPVVDKIFNRLLEIHKNNPFIDTLRDGYNSEGIPYGLLSKYEMLSEAKSNPYFIEWLKKVKDPNTNIWQRIVNFLRQLIGLQPINSAYDRIQSIINSNTFKDKQEFDIFAGQEYWAGLNIPNLYLEQSWATSIEAINNDIETNINSKFREYFDKLTKNIDSLQKRLDSKNQNDKNKIKIIKGLIDDHYNIKKKQYVVETGLRMLVATEDVVKSIDKDLKSIDSDATLTNDQKLLALKAIQEKATSIEFMEPLLNELSIELRDFQGRVSSIDDILNTINNIKSIRAQIQKRHLNIIMPYVEQSFIDHNKQAEVAADKIRETIKNIKELQTKSSSESEKNFYNRRIEEEERKLLKIPVKETIKNIMEGKFEDVGFFDYWAQSMAMNNHPAVQTLGRIIADQMALVAARRVWTSNRLQTIWDEYDKQAGIKGLNSHRDLKKAYSDPVSDTVRIVIGGKINEKGEFVEETINHRAWLDNVNYELIYEITKRKREIEAWEDKRRESKDFDEKNQITEKIVDLRDKLSKFRKEHEEREFIDDYYTPYDILHEKIENTSLYEERKELFDRLRDIEEKGLSGLTKIEREELIEQQKQLNREIVLLGRKYDEDGNEKTGLEKKLYEQYQKYREARAKIGQYQLTEEGQKLYNEKLQDIEDQYRIDKNTIEAKIKIHENKIATNPDNIERYQKSLENLKKELIQLDKDKEEKILEITRVVPTEEFEQLRKDNEDELNKLTEKILSIPELAAQFNKQELDKIRKEGYQWIRDNVAPYRDNDGTIDGVALNENSEKIVKNIKAIQETIEGFLQRNEDIELQGLRSKSTVVELSDKEKTRLDELSAKKKQRKEVFKKYDDIVTEYFQVLSNLKALYKTEETEEYKQEKERQINLLAKSKLSFIEDNFEEKLKEHDIVESNGQFSRFGYFINGDRKAVVSMIAKIEAEYEIKDTNWWKNNHYTVNEWTGTQYSPEEKPIYIWQKRTPSDESYLKKVPTLKFNTFVYNEGLENANYRKISKDVAFPKQSSKYFGNKKYQDLQSGTSTKQKAEFRLLNKMRDLQREIEEYSMMREGQKVYNLHPSVPKTEQEVKISMTNEVLKGKGLSSLKEWKKQVFSPDQGEEYSVLFGGSISDKYVRRKEVPYRFNTEDMEETEQTDNLFHMLSVYDNYNTYAVRMKDVQPIAEAIKQVADNISVTNESLYAGAMSIASIVKYFKSKGGQRIKTQKDENTNLSKDIEHILNTFFYGQTKDSAIINTPLGSIDAQKAISSLKKEASRMIFSFKTFTAIKNSLAGFINAGIINANVMKGWFTHKDYAWGVAKTMYYMKDLIDDYIKLRGGNKSFINQMLEYFQVVNGAIHDEFGNKVQWSSWIEKGHFFMLPKHFSELKLQMAAFLAHSHATKVELKDGTKVDFIEAFQIRDGKVEIKEGAKITQQDVLDFSAKVKDTNLRINGAFKADEKSRFSKTPFGSLAEFLMGYVMPGIKNRFGSGGYSSFTGAYHKGYYREALSFYWNLLKYRNTIIKNWHTYDYEHRSRIIRGSYEIGMVVFLTLLASLMGGGDPKKKLKQNSPEYNYLLGLTIAVASEVQTFTPLPLLGMDEFIRKFSNPFAVSTSLKLYGKTITDGINLITGSDSARFKVKGIDDGFHDKGDVKVIADFIKLTGFDYKEFSSVDKVVGVQSFQNQVR